MKVFFADHQAVPLPTGHRFPMGKYGMLRAALLSEGVLRPEEIFEAPLAERAELERVHGKAYLDGLFHGRLTEDELRRLGFPWSEALLRRSRASVGGTVSAARAALVDGVSGNLAGGTHHAFADHGEGYCVFNDLAVATRTLQAEGLVRRVLIVDLDVHQGNGTAAIFAGDDDVFTFSMHGEKNFPFRKSRSHRDVGLADGTGDGGFLSVLEEHLPVVFEASQPELVLYQAGVDPLAEDTLGRLSLTHDGLMARDEYVLSFCWSRGVPIALTLGGGYAKPIEHSVRAHVNTYRVVKRVCVGG